VTSDLGSGTENEDRGSDPVASAGEFGLADDAATDAGLAQVIVGEIPDAGDPSRMLWTARCTVARHGLLGTFEDRAEAEVAKQQHLVTAHGQQIAQ
jgi:hypothetical protein